MIKPDLRQLLASSKHTIGELMEREPSLFAELRTLARGQVRKLLAAGFADAPEELRQRAAGLNLDHVAVGDAPAAIRRALTERLPPDLVEEAEKRLTRLEDAGAFVDPLTERDVPIRDLPLVQPLVAQAKVHAVAGLARIGEAQIARVLERAPSISAIDDAVLEEMVTAGELEEHEARELGLAAGLFQLLDEDEALAAAVKGARVDRLPGGKVTSVRDLCALDAAAFRDLLQRSRVAPPVGTDLDTYARSLARRVAALYPSASFLRRLPAAAPGATPAELARLANAYPGLDLAGVLDDPGRTPAEKTAVVVRRIGLIDALENKHPNRELLFLDYAPDGDDLASLDLDRMGMSVDEQRMVVSTLKAYQRAHALAGDVDDARTILTAGIASATEAATMRLDDFEARTGLDDATARKLHKKAQSTLGMTTAAAATAIDLVKGGFDRLGVGNVGPDARDMLRKLPGFADLFGDQAYCRCDQCRSILGPAAYFVDLMTFVEEHVRARFFTGPNAGHALDLATRRPDLWKLPLTCENTNDLLPTLQIVNEVLENYIATRRGLTIDPTDRSALEDTVYGKVLATANGLFQQPFHLALERLTAYLDHFGVRRANVARAVGASGAQVTQAELGLAQIEYDLVRLASLNIASLGKLYGVAFQIQAALPGHPDIHPLSVPAEADVQHFIRAMGVRRDELGAIVTARFVAAGPGAAPRIVAGKRSPDSVQNDVERLQDLTNDALDRMHRFTRLWRRLSWSVGELDLVLTQLGETTLDASTLDRIVSLRRVQDRLGTSVEETCALAGDIPAFPVTAGGTSLMDRLFNTPVPTSPATKLPAPGYAFLHPSQRAPGAPAKSEPMLPRLLAGLRVSDEDLVRLATCLAGSLHGAPHFDIATRSPLKLSIPALFQALGIADGSFALSAANLSLLYRHARLCERIHLSIPELFQLLGLIDAIPGGVMRNLDDLTTLLDVHAWQQQSGYSLDDLGFILDKTVLAPEAYPRAKDIADRVIADTIASSTLAFADTVFAIELGVTEDVSRSILQAIATSVVQAGDVYHLADDFDPGAPLDLPGDLGIGEDSVRAVLRNYHPVAVVPRRLSSALRLPVDRIEALLEALGATLLGPGMADALRAASADAPEAKPLVDLITALLPFTVLFKSPAFGTGAIRFVSTHRDAFGLAALPSVDLAGLRALSIYARLAGTSAEARFTSDAPPIDPADLQKVLADFDPVTGFPAADDLLLARALRTTAGTIATLREHIHLSSPAAAALDHLARSVDLARTLGVGGDALALMASGDYDPLARAADAMLGAFRARYADEAELRDKLEPYEDRLRARKRDALTAYLMHSIEPRFESRRAIYEYFLIDVDLEGCARTSRVVSATNSVQLYVQRCLMDLEQTAPDAPHPIHVTIAEDAAAEWEWRKAYRRWEANRKVFLYPENYLEPDLRDDKTPLFEELASELLQKAIDDQSVLDAYAKYLAGFEEAAKLTIAGAYYDDRTDTLHLLGVTASDPPAYHHRAIEKPFTRGTEWHPWRKISVQIPVRSASPVVYLGRLHVFWIEIRTQSFSKVQAGGSIFLGYRHKLSLEFVAQRLDGTWTPPQEITLPNDMGNGDKMAGMVTDYFDTIGIPFVNPGTNRKVQLEFPDTRKPARLKLIDYTESPVDDYTLHGPNWEEVFLEPRGASLTMVARNFRLIADVDLFRRVAHRLAKVGYAPTISAPHPRIPLVCTRRSDSSVYYAHPERWYTRPNAFANLVLEEERIVSFDGEYDNVNDTHLTDDLYNPKRRIATLQPGFSLRAIAGSIRDVIAQDGPDALLLQRTRRQDDAYTYHLRRIGTTLAGDVAQRLFLDGIDGLLDRHTQETLREAAPALTPAGARFHDATNQGKLDFKGPAGAYYREIFFHIPCLLADHLNSQGQYAAAQRWYHYVFDPTARGAGADRAWQYLELRNLDAPKLRDVLTDSAAIAAYERDPFNPHAIARLRLSAYQKSVVMRYIDNLLDWGDSLFAEFTMESVNEATMLYAMAADILGERPHEIPDCGEASGARTYEQIAPSLGKGSTFLVEFESYTLGKSFASPGSGTARTSRFAVDPEALHDALAGANEADTERAAGETADERAGRGSTAWTRTATSGWTAGRGVRRGGAGEVQRAVDHGTSSLLAASAPSLGWSLVRQIGPLFCVPPNEELFAYWDRVEDRLYKIHNCLDLQGVRRDLALFAPELDPRLLAKMKAEELTLDEVMSVTSGDLPPYRFVYLVEKAKAFAATLREFGAALLAALEKRDTEQLARLRLVHEQNLARMNTQLRQQEIDAAEEALASTERQREAAVLRRDYYQAQIDQDLTQWERKEQVARHTVTTIRGGLPALRLMQGVLGLLPQLGSPFALKFGGVELKSGAEGFALATEMLAAAAESAAASTSVEATFDRRRIDWKFQRDLAERDLQQLDRQVKAAEIRRDIAVKSLEIHEKTIAQTEEIHAFYGDKFTSFGLYTWMAATLQRSYRQAYANALSLARLCEAAFRFERDDDPSVGLGTGYWDGARAGLLAGDQLLLDLQALERRFLETNYRQLEIDQSFPLTQLDPAALLRLRETGECQFEIPEIAFDLAYPGHYRRRIKAVRLTLPCVSGPYTNVSATLTLTGSKVRRDPDPAPGALELMPPRRSVSIATSRAENDAGVFELSFHDERYMPFEGAGAVSAWRLTLPKSFRPFDYQTISDVVVTIAYTALDGGDGFRGQIEGQNDALQGAILDHLTARPAGRLFDLRQEFPVAYEELLASPPGTPVRFAIQDRHFPAFVTASGRKIQVTKALLALKTAGEVALDGVQLVVDGETVGGFAASDELGGLPAKELTGAFMKTVKGGHTLAVSAAGGLVLPPPTPDASPAIDGEKLANVFLYVEYKITVS